MEPKHYFLRVGDGIEMEVTRETYLQAQMGDNTPRGKGKPKAAATFTSYSRAGEIITGRATWW